MCEFCRAYAEVKGVNDYRIDLFKVVRDPETNSRQLHSVASVANDKIKYCPKCGRRINK